MFKKIKNSVLQRGMGNISIFKSKNVTVNQIQVMDQMQRYLQNGEVDNAVTLLKQMEDFVHSRHPCAPFWKYEFGIDKNGRKYISHVPAFAGAEKEMPLTGRMYVVIPSHYKKFKTMKNLLNFSYGMQQEIEFDLKSLKTWIGETLIDEFEATESSNTKIKLIPSEFPPPLPMKLYLKDNSWSIDYLLIGAERIEGSTITLSNHKQNDAPMAIELIMNLSLSTANFNIKLTDGGVNSVKYILKYLDLVDKSKKTSKPELALKLLENDTDVISSPNWDFNDNEETEPEVYITLKKVHHIEEEYSIEFMFPNRAFTDFELYIIDVLYHTVKDGYFRRDFKDSYTITIDNYSEIQKLLGIHDKDSCLNFQLANPSNDPFELFGIKFKPVSNQVIFDNVKLDMPEKLRMKSKLLDAGEHVNVKLIAYNDESYISERLIVEPINNNL
ncbi:MULTISPECIES: hypothetical protein [Lysinibacillus]|uniref:Uncharacterized protein n=1 Tax=Lysinibacillus xylanilyticus TaxID=582475 RepID=A0ABV3VVT8_9BACI